MESNSALRLDEQNDAPIMMKFGHSACSLDNVPNSPTRSPEKKLSLNVITPPIIDKSSLRRNTSYGNILATNNTEAKVLVIYTGGTIGMIRNRNNALAPLPNALVKNLRRYPNLHDEEYAKERFGAASAMAPLVLPHVTGEARRIMYTITEYDPILDSSNMTMNDWIHIAEDIKQSYEFFDGFVILHGTDTLSYTASALSFMLENLGKTIIITGSQIPIFETRTDGKDNFLSALIIAGNYVIPEVCVFFGTKLLRGNRTIKVSSASLDAFDTPNFPHIAKAGILIEIDYRLIFRPCSVEKFTVHTKLDKNVGLLRIFPSITLQTVRAFLSPPMKGVVLQTFGSGNIPSNREDLMDEFRKASQNGILIVNCTQCTSGSVREIYDTGRLLNECGVISGFDMTPETALTKLSYVLTKDELSFEAKQKIMQSSLRGELTSEKACINMQDYDLVDAVARSLHLSTPQELAQLGNTLFPAMINSSVVAGDLPKIDILKGYGADLSAVNYDRRTALHVACAEGNLDMVRHLLLNGATVHMRDRYDRTPLLEAISCDHHDIIKILMKCGSHITGSARAVGEHLCGAASRGSMKRLESYRLAGADLSQPDPSGRTALHLAALFGYEDIIEFLITKCGVNKFEADMMGMTALDYAKRGGNKMIINILSEIDEIDNHRNGDVVGQNGRMFSN